MTSVTCFINMYTIYPGTQKGVRLSLLPHIYLFTCCPASSVLPVGGGAVWGLPAQRIQARAHQHGPGAPHTGEHQVSVKGSSQHPLGPEDTLFFSVVEPKCRLCCGIGSL